MASTKRKKNRNNHIRRMFLGAHLEFDGNEENGQVAEFANGTMFGQCDIDQLIKGTFKWDVTASFEFKSGNFTRTHEEHFKAGPCRFNDLSGYADELSTKAGIGMPEGYEFSKNTWKARIIGC